MLSLTSSDAAPTAAVRPGAAIGPADTAASEEAVEPAGTAAFSGPTPTSPVASEIAEAGSSPLTETAALAANTGTTPAAPDAASSAADDLATQRILAAENAPTAAGPADAGRRVATPPGAIASGDPSAANRPGFLNSLFGSRRDDEGRPRPLVATASASAPRPVIARSAEQPRPVIATASASGGVNAGLPGFDRDRAFGINTDGGGGQELEAPVQLASAAGLARLAPNGLRRQHSGVDVTCLKPALVRLLKRVEQRYGQPVIVTSGYRSPARNRAARGAKNSLHMYCAAADIQVAGVSKWDLAAYLRSVPGRGGVGTYCHTKSVHIDIGPKRDWNWRCRRRG